MITKKFAAFALEAAKAAALSDTAQSAVASLDAEDCDGDLAEIEGIARAQTSAELTRQLDDAYEQLHDCQSACDARDISIQKLRRQIAMLENIIREDLHPDDCSDELNRTIVEEIKYREAP